MTEKVFVPPLKIQGIKTKLVPLIQKNIALASSSVWVEPFMGSGVVGFNVEPRYAIFADTNPHIIAFYNQIKSGKITPHLVRTFLEQEGTRLEEGDDAYYYAVRQRFNQYHDPLDFLFLNRSCFNGMIRFNRNYDFNVPYGHKPQRFSKAYITKIVNQVAHTAFLLQQHSWEFLCQPFQDTIAMAKESDFVYCDPPYIGRNVDYYDNWDATSEIALQHALTQSKAKYMVSTWDHNAYRTNHYIDSVWHSCHKITQAHFYHVGARESNRNAVVEALLTNYSAADNCNSLLRGSEQLSFDDMSHVG